jgi:lactate 2-monooxygenase
MEEHMARQFGDFQFDIYLDGTRGILSRYPIDFATLEAKAAQALPPWILSYVAGGAGNEHTQRANIEAFNEWGIVPRICRNSVERDLSIELFGRSLPTPIFTAPIGVIGLCAQDFHGDLQTARAGARLGVPVMQSTLGMDTLEDVAAAMGDNPGYFQLYMPDDRDLTASFIHRAETAGYQALVVTLDTWIPGWRPRDLSLANFPQLRGFCLTNYFTDEHFRKRLAKTPEDDPRGATDEWAKIFGHAVSWDDVHWLREITSIPLVLKGVADPDDARRAIDLGVDALYCSNHGGRQANGGLPSLATLPDVVAAAGDVPVLFDSGVRSGTDVVKALSLGATAVGIGRSFAYALALGGEDGVVHHLRSILAEADLLMAIDGFSTINELRQTPMRRVPAH